MRGGHVLAKHVGNVSEPRPQNEYNRNPSYEGNNINLSEMHTDQKGGEQDSGSTGHAEPRPQNEYHRNPSYEGNNINLSEMHTVHMRSRTGEDPHSCIISGKNVVFSSNLGSHTETHTGEKWNPCCTEPPQIEEEQEELCTNQKGGEQDSGSTGHAEPRPQNQHRKRHQNKLSEMHCDTRQDSGESARDSEPKKRNQHPESSNNANNTDLSEMQSDTHTGKQPLKCDKCEKYFKYRSSLERHLIIHTGEKPYSCNTCGKRFTQKSKLNYHTKTHKGEKPYSCKIVKKNRIRIHTSEKLCGIFPILHSHVETHTGEELPKINEEQEELCTTQ
ncbi:hypothetical protein F7725_005304, partial [Dissostichus mawsoni]